MEKYQRTTRWRGVSDPRGMGTVVVATGRGRCGQWGATLRYFRDPLEATRGRHRVGIALWRHYHWTCTRVTSWCEGEALCLYRQ
jgi:hypothetical protein